MKCGWFAILAKRFPTFACPLQFACGTFIWSFHLPSSSSSSILIFHLFSFLSLVYTPSFLFYASFYVISYAMDFILSFFLSLYLSAPLSLCSFPSCISSFSLSAVLRCGFGSLTMLASECTSRIRNFKAVTQRYVILMDRVSFRDIAFLRNRLFGTWYDACENIIIINVYIIHVQYDFSRILMKIMFLSNL